MLEDSLAQLDRFINAREWNLARAWWRLARTRSDSNVGLHYHKLISSRDPKSNQGVSPNYAEPIRLLLLYPASASTASTLHAKFVRASLATPPEYEALSYTWGNPFANPLAIGNEDHENRPIFRKADDAPNNNVKQNGPPDESPLRQCRTAQQHRAWSASERRHVVCVNGHNVGVGQNLYDALLAIRDPRRKKLIWVDALCINQADDDEKRHQVSIMNLIYRGASRVFVWLGPGKPYSTFLRTNSGYHLDVDGENAVNDDHSRPQDPWIVNRMVLFGRVFTSSWFQRLWIVQEAAVAQDLVFRCGNVVVELWELEALARTWAQVDLLEVGYKSELDEEIVHRALRSFNRIAAVRTVTDCIRLEVSMRAWRRGLCSDPRDRVYALLSISRRTKSNRLLLEPDYSLSSDELGRLLVIKSIREYETLDVLRYIIHTADLARGSATWAIQLQTNDERKGGAGEAASPVIEPSELVISVSEPPYRHPRRPLPFYHENKESKEGRRHVLILSGRAVLRIPAVGGTIYEPQHTISQESDPNNSYRFKVLTPLSTPDATRFSKYVEQMGPATTIDANDNINSELLQDNDFFPGAQPIPGSIGDNSLADLRYMYERLSVRWDWNVPPYGDYEDQAAAVFERSVNARFPSEMYTLRRLALASSRKSDHAQCNADGQKYTEKTQGRNSCGIYHAIVPRGTQPGDVIAMLSHSRTPFVLRPLAGSESTENDPTKPSSPTSAADERRFNGSAGGKRIQIKAPSQETGHTGQPVHSEQATEKGGDAVSPKQEISNATRPLSSASSASARTRTRLKTAAAAATTTFSLSARSRSRSLSGSRSRSRASLGEQEDREAKGKRRGRMSGAVSPLSFADGSDGMAGAGPSGKHGEKRPMRKKMEYTFVGACYIDHRLDWEAFEALEMHEVDEMWIY